MRYLIQKRLMLIGLVVSTHFTFAQTGASQPQSLDSLQNKVMKLMKFYDSYDDGSPESLKKAKYNDAVDELTGGTVSAKDKADAYKIIDAYIKGDKALENNEEPDKEEKEDLDEILQNSDEVKRAKEIIEQQKTLWMQMSYSDFESAIQGVNPTINTKEIKEAYNQMHKNDGKKVEIREADNKMTDAQKQMWAIGVLNNPKNYEEAKKALKILKPEISESEMKAAWAKRNK